jgi:hypothetical protein
MVWRATFIHDLTMSTAILTPSPQTAQKPTTAQWVWLKTIDTGVCERIGDDWLDVVRNRQPRAGHAQRTSYLMTCELRRSGWIDAQPIPGANAFRIVLTEAGKQALGA